jgi:hypothetical protein
MSASSGQPLRRILALAREGLGEVADAGSATAVASVV